MNSGRSYRLAVIPGDGVGIEVTKVATTVLQTAASRYGFEVDLTEYDLGGKRYQATGEVLPDSVMEELATHHAILLGAVGTPAVEPGILERGLLLRLRFEFDQYVNLRPVKLYEGVPTPIAGLTPDRCDLVVVRENTEGPYVGSGGIFKRDTAHEIAIQESINSRHGVERVLRYAFALAAERRGHLTVCHKTNVLNYAGEMWWRIAQSLQEEYADVDLEYVHADAACLYLVSAPERFDVVVTDNLFGDIITDVGAAVQGGMGVAASGNIDPSGDHPSMFEPVHGSAPDIAGRGWANPVAAVLSAALCARQLGESEAADRMERASASVLPELGSMGGPDMGMSTEEISDHIVARIEA